MQLAAYKFLTKRNWRICMNNLSLEFYMSLSGSKIKKCISFKPCPCQVEESTYENKLQLGNSVFDAAVTEEITTFHYVEFY